MSNQKPRSGCGCIVVVIVLLAGSSLVVLGCCGIPVLLRISDAQQRVQQMAAADRDYEAGRKRHAVEVYKTHYERTTDKSKYLSRIVETEIEQGSKADAKAWITKGIEGGVKAEYDSDAAKDLFAQATKEVEENRARIAREKEAGLAEEKRKIAEAGQAAQRRINDNLDKFMLVVDKGNKAANKAMIRHVRVTSEDKVIITVDNAWHLVTYQLRLQIAQNLWTQWVAIASPGDPDKARMQIVDHNGNEVGGYSVWNGVWVQKH